MNREDILRLADKVGMMPFAMAPRYQSQLAKQLGEFAALVAAAEREACAKVCEDEAAEFRSQKEGRRGARYDWKYDWKEDAAMECSLAIRSRGEVKP